jgi:hypothetical protein
MWINTVHRLLQNFDGCCAYTESLQDSGNVDQVTHDIRAFNHRGHDDRVSGKERLMIEA